MLFRSDPKAIAAAVRTEERIAKLMGTDAATLFKVEADVVSRQSDANEVQSMLDNFFGRTNTQPDTKTIPGEVVTSAGYTRPRRPLKKSAPITYAQHNTEDEFATDNTFQPNEVQEEAITLAEDIEPAPHPRTQKRSNPLLRDYDD